MRIRPQQDSSKSLANRMPIASLSVDLDNQWSYMKTHGDRGWEAYPSYLDTVVPRILAVLAEHDLKATFFVVGRDASLRKNRESIASIASAGHEIGNHSFNHNPWLHLYTERDLEYELQLAEEAITSATGQHPVGFRAPGYSFSKRTLRVLQRRGYIYDATILPTFLGPLARAYYFAHADLSNEDREKRKALFGNFRDGFRPLRPYRWKVDPESEVEGLIEIPVSTLPILRMPFHVSYILYIAGYSRKLATTYFKAALVMCRLAGVQPSLLLHPLDFLGSDEVPDLTFFPGMKFPRNPKLQLVSQLIRWYSERFNVMTLIQHARAFARDSAFAVAEPSLGSG